MINNYKVGDFFEKDFYIDYETGKQFAAVSTDCNPIHIDEEVASKSRFGKRIAHGMLIGSYISAILGNDFPGNGTVYMKQDLTFRAPVYYESTVKVRVEISEIIPEKNRFILTTQAFDEAGKLLVDGHAMVLKED